MTTSEFPEPSQANPSHAEQGHAEPRQAQLDKTDQPPAGEPAERSEHRAGTVVLRNSRIVCWLTMGMGVISVFLGICMMLMVVSLLFPLSAITFMRVLAAVQWGLGGFLMCMMCPWLWRWGTRMLGFSVKLDARGVDFNLGTKKQPRELFMAWESVAAVEQKRVGNVREYTIRGKDGGWASFTSNSFFRSMHVARTVAERAGLAIKKS